MGCQLYECRSKDTGGDICSIPPFKQVFSVQPKLILYGTKIDGNVIFVVQLGLLFGLSRELVSFLYAAIFSTVTLKHSIESLKRISVVPSGPKWIF